VDVAHAARQPRSNGETLSLVEKLENGSTKAGQSHSPACRMA
jgi:hypothetical protein